MQIWKAGVPLAAWFISEPQQNDLSLREAADPVEKM